MAGQCSSGTGFSPVAILVMNDAGTSSRRASLIARPLSSPSQSLSNMGRIVFPLGEKLSTPRGNFFCPPRVAQSLDMNPVIVEETRRTRLSMLVRKYKGMAELCEALGLARNQTSGLTRILNANVRHDRASQPYVMGSPMARDIETKLELPSGWMDTPPTYAELNDQDDPRTKMLQLMEKLPEDEWPTAVRLLDALVKPAIKNGTTG